MIEPHMCGKCNEPVVLRQTGDYENFTYGFEIMNFDGKRRHDCTEREKLK